MSLSEKRRRVTARDSVRARKDDEIIAEQAKRTRRRSITIFFFFRNWGTMVRHRIRTCSPVSVTPEVDGEPTARARGESRRGGCTTHLAEDPTEGTVLRRWHSAAAPSSTSKRSDGGEHRAWVSALIYRNGARDRPASGRLGTGVAALHEVEKC